jgi:hypothetical protein
MLVECLQRLDSIVIVAAALNTFFSFAVHGAMKQLRIEQPADMTVPRLDAQKCRLRQITLNHSVTLKSRKFSVMGWLICKIFK